jgi:small subunit ribosomal protein S21
MLIIPVKEGESIEKALKKFKRKVEKTGLIKQLRERQKFTKPSIVRREEIKRAIYSNTFKANQES